MRKTDEANTEAKRDIILRAAGRCFTELGLHSASMQDICKAAGMRSGHVYYYFQSRDAIMEAVFERGTEGLVDRVKHMLDGDADIARTLVGMHEIEEATRRAWNFGPGLRLEFGAEIVRNPRLREVYQRRMQQLMEAIREAATTAISNGRLDPSFGVDNFVRIIVLLWFGIGVARVEGDEEIPLFETAIATLLQPWLRRPSEETTLQQAPPQQAKPKRQVRPRTGKKKS